MGVSERETDYKIIERKRDRLYENREKERERERETEIERDRL